MEFSRQEYWNGLSFPSPGDLPNPGIEPRSPHCRQTFYRLSHQRPAQICYFLVVDIRNGVTLKVNITDFCKPGLQFLWKYYVLKNLKIYLLLDTRWTKSLV